MKRYPQLSFRGLSSCALRNDNVAGMPVTLSAADTAAVSVRSKGRLKAAVRS